MSFGVAISEPEVVPQTIPWEDKPHGVVSLLDMLTASSADLVALIQEVAALRCDLNVALAVADASQRPFLPVNKPDPIPILNQEQAERMQGVLEEAALASKNLVLSATQRKAEYLQQRYPKGNYAFKVADVLKDLEHLEVDFLNDLTAIKFLRLHSVRGELFLDERQDIHVFGNEVAASFPSCCFDVREAANCYALERWAACVFHLMRTLEIALSALADRFGVSHDKGNWHNVIEGIESKVRKIDASCGPDWKKQQKDFSDAATQFMFFKEAWRNHVMHVRDVYDEGRASSIWQHVREFIQKLAGMGLRELP